MLSSSLPEIDESLAVGASPRPTLRWPGSAGRRSLLGLLDGRKRIFNLSRAGTPGLPRRARLGFPS